MRFSRAIVLSLTASDIKTDIDNMTKRIFGRNSSVFVRMVKRILTPSGQEALGKYYQSIIEIVEGTGVENKTFLHEAFHAITDKFLNPAEKNILFKEAQKSFDAEIKNYAKRHGISYETATEEILADKFVDYAAGRQGIIGRLKVLFERLLNRIKAYLGNEDAINSIYADIWGGKFADNGNVNAQGLQQSEAYKENSEKIFEPTEEDKQTYDRSLRKAFRNKNKGHNPIIELGKTPVVLQALGVENLPVKTDKFILLKIIGGIEHINPHNINVETLTIMPDLLHNPAMIIKSTSAKNSFVLVLDATDNSGRQVVAIFEKRGSDYHFMPSMYGKDEIQRFVDSNLKNGNVLYIKEKNLKVSGRLQLPPLDGLQGSYGGILTKADIISKYQRAWHGTGVKGITEFSNDKIGSGEGAQAFGWGLYFSSLKSIAQWYRKKLSRNSFEIDGQEVEADRDPILPVFEDFAKWDNIYTPMDLANLLQQYGRKGAISYLETLKKQNPHEIDTINNIDRGIKLIKEATIYENTGQLYEVEIPESKDFLQWDKPFSEQASLIQANLIHIGNALGQEIKEDLKEAEKSDFLKGKGQDIYFRIGKLSINKLKDKEMVKEWRQQGDENTAVMRAATLVLSNYNIVGNEYPSDSLGGISGSKGRNFVLFDPKRIEIKKTYYKRADGENSRIKEAENTANKEAKEVLMNPVKIAERFITLQKVINILKKLAGKEIKNIQTGITAQVNSIQIHKIVSNKAVEKSILNGFTRNQHYLAASVIDKLFENAILKETRKDKNNDVNIKSIKRFNATTEFENEAGKTKKGIAYLTLKESIKAGHRIYSIELQKIERLQGRLNNSNEGGTLASTHTAPPGASGGLSPTISNNNATYSATAYNTVSASGIKSLISDSTPTAHNRSVNESFYQGQGNIKKQNDDVKYSRAETFDNSLIPADTINNSAQDETNQNKAQEKPVGQFKTLKDKIFNEKRYRQFLDRGHSIDILEKKAQKLGVKTDVYKQFRLNAGGVGRAKSALLYGTYSLNKDGNIEWNGEGLQQIINDAKKISDTKNTDEIMQDLHDCLIAKRYIADLMQRKDVDVTKGQLFKSNKTMFRLMKEYGNSDKIEGIANRLYEYQKRVLHILVDGGVLTQKQYNRIVELNPHYVPLQRIIDETETNGVKNLGVKAIYNIKGSDKAEKNIFESIIKNTYTIIESANNNRLIKGIADLARLFPVQIKRRNFLFETKTGIEMAKKLTPGEISAEMTTHMLAEKGKGKNIYVYYENGLRKFIETDDGLADGLGRASREERNKIVEGLFKFLQMSATVMRKGATTYSISFIYRNPIRDSLAAFIQGKNGFIPLYHSLQGIKAIIQKDADFKAYFASGASFGSFMDMSDANLAKIAKGMIAANSRKINMGKIWKYTMGNLGRKRIARRNPC